MLLVGLRFGSVFLGVWVLRSSTSGDCGLCGFDVIGCVFAFLGLGVFTLWVCGWFPIDWWLGLLDAVAWYAGRYFTSGFLVYVLVSVCYLVLVCLVLCDWFGGCFMFG